MFLQLDLSFFMYYFELCIIMNSIILKLTQQFHYFENSFYDQGILLKFILCLILSRFAMRLDAFNKAISNRISQLY